VTIVLIFLGLGLEEPLVDDRGVKAVEVPVDREVLLVLIELHQVEQPRRVLHPVHDALLQRRVHLFAGDGSGVSPEALHHGHVVGGSAWCGS
jgi:hypothetical protein